MSSAESKGFHKFCRKFLPFLLMKCPAWNLHFIWQKECRCMYGTNGEKDLLRYKGQWLRVNDLKDFYKE